MTQPRTSRSSIPTPRALGLMHPKAADDLADLGWNDERHVDVLWTLAAAGDPDLALNNVIRLADALDAEGRAGLLETLATEPVVRRRLFALFGGSTLLGDHIVANPTTWEELAKPLPTAAELLEIMHGSVGVQAVEYPAAGAEPGAEPGSAADGASPRIVNKATLTGVAAVPAMQSAYRTLIARIAAIDLASTLVERGVEVPEPLAFEVVSRRLSDAADAALSTALAVACSTVYGGPDAPADAVVPPRLCVIAMGKCGAQELNYISDVDVIFVTDATDAKATRWAGEFINLGSRAFFEVDAGLRPEGKSGALVRTLESHVTYYDRWAQTWEFQALLKARPMIGDMELGQSYIEALSPKVWVAAERESFVEDVQAMRRRVIENVPEDLRSRELKLGPGGLRDVEFAVQLLQMVHGRTDESLRVLSTVEALRALRDGGYVGRDDTETLLRTYTFMRLLEHRLQLHRLKRTHTLPESSDEVALRWLARTSGRVASAGRSVVEQLLADVRKASVEIRQLHQKLFYRPLLSALASMDADTVRLSPDAARRQLAALGYEYPDRAWEHLSALASGENRRAKLQAIILPSLLAWLAETADPDAGLLNYRKLSEAAKDAVWFLRLLRDETIVGQRLMTILGTSPYAAELIINSIDTVKLLGDGASGPKLLDKKPAVVTHSLVAAASRHKKPDKAISIARSLRRAELCRIACADLLAFMEVEEVCLSLSWIWDAVLEAALQAEIRHWENEHDTNAPATITVIGMGRLGGAELGYGSDADVLFVTAPRAAADDELDDTERDAAAVRWATRICDSVRRRLGKPSQDPPLDVDLDLRPEGRNGPVVRTLDSYRRYYEQWGETWEMQALLRATWIAGDKDLGIAFLRMIDEFRYPEDGVDDATVTQVRRMKARVDSERLPRGADRNTHTKLGRGALTDVEWTVQLLVMQHAHQHPTLHNTSTLASLRELAAAELISEADAMRLRESWITATIARNAIVLVKGKRKDQLPSHGQDLRHVAAAAGWKPEQAQAFLDDYLKKTRKARRVVDRVFWGEESAFDLER